MSARFLFFLFMELLPMLVGSSSMPLDPTPTASSNERLLESSETDVEWGRSILPSVPSYSDDGDGKETEVEVAIVGGGLAGLAVAIGLHRAKIPCRVYERAPELRSVSQGVLSVDPHGMNALEAMHPDLPRLIEEAGNELLHSQHHALSPNEEDNSTNKAPLKETIKKKDVGRECREKHGRVRVLMTWAGLQQILASLLPEDAIVTNRSLVSFDENENNVVLHFAEQQVGGGSRKVRHQRVRAKCVLASDGVFSMARKQLFQNTSDDDHPVYFGQLNWGSVIPTNLLPHHAHPLANTVQVFSYNGDNTKGRWMSMLIDGGKGQTFWQLRVADAAMARSMSPSKGRGGLGLPGAKASLLPLVVDTQVASLLEATPESQIFERSIVGRLPGSTWLSNQKRLALVGDAAHGMHPVCGQGANSAFCSVRVVAECMKEAWEQGGGDNNSSHNWQDALATYEKLRKPKADIVQQWSNLVGCNQAGGGISLPQWEVQAKILDWIMQGEPCDFPDSESLALLQSFDPCSTQGVSKIR